MSQAVEASLSMSTRSVGSLAIDPSRIVGSGGGLNPALIVHVAVVLLPESAGPVALTDIEALLLMAGTAPVPLGGWVSPSVRQVYHSAPGQAARRDDEFRFPLTPELMQLLDLECCAMDNREVAFSLEARAKVHWVRASANSFGSSSVLPAFQTPFPTSAGMLHDLVPFDLPAIAQASFTISREQWAESILPGLGLDRVRLLTVKLPRAGAALSADCVRHFDEARREHDAGRFRSSVRACRDVRETVERDMGVKKGHVDEALARSLAVPANSPMLSLVQRCWGALDEMTNRASHPNDSAWFARVEVRATLLLTATLLEAVSELIATAETTDRSE